MKVGSDQLCWRLCWVQRTHLNLLVAYRVKLLRFVGLVVYNGLFNQSRRLTTDIHKFADRAKRPEAADVSSGYWLLVTG